MKWLIAVLAPALLALAAPASAAEGLFLTWGDCALGGAGTSNSLIPCNVDAQLYVAFSLGQAVDQVLGIEAVVDLQSASDPLPDWWHFELAGASTAAGCRAGHLSASRDFTAAATCVDPWVATTGDALVQDYQLLTPRGGTNQARIRATAFVSLGAPLSLDATHQYYGLKLILDNANLTICGGCTTPVCLVLNSIWLRRPSIVGGDMLLTQPGPLGANWASWRAENTPDCQSVPVHRTTWGLLKSLYRH